MTAAGTVIDAVSDLLPDETRSIVVEVVNLTSRSLVKGGDSFAHGGFGPTLPAAAIPAFRSDVFSVESGGLATGVEGWVTYTAWRVPGGRRHDSQRSFNHAVRF